MILVLLALTATLDLLARPGILGLTVTLAQRVTQEAGRPDNCFYRQPVVGPPQRVAARCRPRLNMVLTM